MQNVTMSDAFRLWEKGAMYGKLSTALIAKTLSDIPELKDKVKVEYSLLEIENPNGKIKDAWHVDMFIEDFGVIEVTMKNKGPDEASLNRWGTAALLEEKVWIVVPDDLVFNPDYRVDSLINRDILENLARVLKVKPPADIKDKIKVISCCDLFIEI